MPKASRVTTPLFVAAALLFAAFIAAKGIPTLRHDWDWPIGRDGVPSFLSETFDGWLPLGFGTPNPHPTTYLIGVPLAVTMWLAGPFAALVLLAAATGYACARCAASVMERWAGSAPAAIGIGLFAAFNPWVYNEVVAGHLVMVLAYAGTIGMFAEMLRGNDASPVRLALWIALVEAQLQLFIVAMVALAIFATATRKWLPLVAGAIVALPSIVGVVAERGALLKIPYGLEWQANQSVAPLALLGLGGYFTGYSDRLGVVANAAVWLMFALAVLGLALTWRRRAAQFAVAAAIVVYAVALGVHGPLAAPYAWAVRNVPETGVFRELYDLAGCLAALSLVLVGAAVARLPRVAWAVLAAGLALPLTWLARPPSDLWVSSAAYPHPEIVGRPFARVALTPAFQPLQLRTGPGDGADPDVHSYPGPVSALNQYYPSYPVDMALARYERFGNADALRALGVAEIVDRPWLISRSQGAIGLAAVSLEPHEDHTALARRDVANATPLISECENASVVSLSAVGSCSIFFGDAPGYAPVSPIAAPADSIDQRAAWIDARLAFARAPELAQGIGGALTESKLPHAVDPGSWLLVYARGRLNAWDGRTLVTSNGAFTWLRVPQDVTKVACDGLCELVAESATLPSVPRVAPPARALALGFTRFAPWIFAVNGPLEGGLVRLDERYDPGWVAFAPSRILRHVRVDDSVNGWFVERPTPRIVLLQLPALLQLIAEVLGMLCVLYFVKALTREPTKRAPS